MKQILNGLRWLIGSFALIAALSIGLIGIAFSDSNENHDDDDDAHQSMRLVLNDPLDTALYREECSACHIAYPAALLPSRSWSALMAQLDNHFGENAELMPETFAQVEQYLLANSADATSSRLGRKALRGLKNSATPLRITELPFYKREHREIPDKYVIGNAEVGSFSQCQACHGQNSERGIFDEDTVKIPGVRRWDS